MKLLAVICLLLSLSSFAEHKIESEVNSQITGGNTDFKSQLFKIKHEKDYTEKFSLSEKASYQYGESDEVRSLEKWLFNIRPEFKLTDKTSLFLSTSYSSNRFSGVDRLLTNDLGVSHIWIKDKKLNLSNSLAYRYSREKQIDGTKKNDSFADIGLRTSYKFNENSEAILELNYLPNFSDSEDDEVTADFDVVTFLGKGFSFKAGYDWKYDGKPAAGKGKHDYTTTLGLIFKY
ncbi:MAG: DUF481 domain-containing protein [Oligoflexia bacterium]|nr:DUF481 domain-containing protein [Oligoflexia bacterium]